MTYFHICVSAHEMPHCHEPMACYGEICVFPALCMKPESELTPDELARVKAMREACNGPEAP